jgi:hypothetical protein
MTETGKFDLVSSMLGLAWALEDKLVADGFGMRR